MPTVTATASATHSDPNRQAIVAAVLDPLLNSPGVNRANAWTTGLTHVVGDGSDRVLLFLVGYENSGSDPGVSAVTYGGQPLVPIIGDVAGTTAFGRVELWYLNEVGIQAATGNTFAGTWGGATPSQPMYAAATYAGVNQSNPISDSASKSTDTSTPNPITASVAVRDGAIVVAGAISGNNGSYTWGVGWTEGTDQASGATTTMSSADTASNPTATATSTPTATPTPTPSLAPSADITVDFGDVVRTLSPLAIGMVESGYGQGYYLTNDPLQRQRLKELNLGQMRMDLDYSVPGDPNSRVICGQGGCPTSIDGEDWISAIKSLGFEPVVIVPMNPTDAANLVKHFNVDTNIRIERWIVFNEPGGQGIGATTYSNKFNTIYDAMKAADPTIEVGGPAAAWFNKNYLQTFLDISGSRADFLDFHQYGQGGPVTKSDAQAMADTIKYEDRINQLRTMIEDTVPGRASEIEIQIGEWNLDWDGDPKDRTQFSAVWGASVLGHILKSGALSLQFADKNGSLGALADETLASRGWARDDPLPIYHAQGMYTGQSLFRPFGSAMVSASASLSNVEVYASDNDKNIVVINKDASKSHNAEFSLKGLSSGTVEVWRKDTALAPKDPPRKLSPASITGGSFSYMIPPYSVTAFVLHPTTSVASAASSPSVDSLGSPLASDGIPPYLPLVVGAPALLASTLMWGRWTGTRRCPHAPHSTTSTRRSKT